MKLVDLDNIFADRNDIKEVAFTLYNNVQYMKETKYLEKFPIPRSRSMNEPLIIDSDIVITEMHLRVAYFPTYPDTHDYIVAVSNGVEEFVGYPNAVTEAGSKYIGMFKDKFWVPDFDGPNRFHAVIGNMPVKDGPDSDPIYVSPIWTFNPWRDNYGRERVHKEFMTIGLWGSYSSGPVELPTVPNLHIRYRFKRGVIYRRGSIFNRKNVLEHPKTFGEFNLNVKAVRFEDDLDDDYISSDVIVMFIPVDPIKPYIAIKPFTDSGIIHRLYTYNVWRGWIVKRWFDKSPQVPDYFYVDWGTVSRSHISEFLFDSLTPSDDDNYVHDMFPHVPYRSEYAYMHMPIEHEIDNIHFDGKEDVIVLYGGKFTSSRPEMTLAVPPPFADPPFPPGAPNFYALMMYMPYIVVIIEFTEYKREGIEI